MHIPKPNSVFIIIQSLVSASLFCVLSTVVNPFSGH